MKDTTPEAEEIFRQRLMALSPVERLTMACGMFDTAKELVIASLAPEDKDSPQKLRCQLFLRFYGQDFSAPEREKILAHLGRS